MFFTYILVNFIIISNDSISYFQARYMTCVKKTMCNILIETDVKFEFIHHSAQLIL